ncbi:hypothetical protein TRVL_07856 [Trypanosoma vivax]|nr:hypothetical protein TRVL_07856 [Trypanosoma vivax]
MALKAKIDVFPFEGYLLQGPSVVNVMHGVARGNKSGGANSAGGEASGSSGSTKRGDGTTNSTAAIQRRIKTPFEKLMSLKARCREQQCVHSVEGVLLVHAHNHPHILLLRHNPKASSRSRVQPATNVNSTMVFRLPGGRCRSGELEESCLLRKLGRDLFNESKHAGRAQAAEEERSETVVDVAGSRGSAGTSTSASSFRVGEVLARWYRPHFDPLMYPYIPPHISENDVREVRTIFLVHLPPHMLLTTTETEEELVAVPLFDLYDNTAKYGSLIASIPTLLSRVNINYCR